MIPAIDIKLPIAGVHNEVIGVGHSPAVAFNMGDISKFYTVLVEAENIDCEIEDGITHSSALLIL